MSIDLPDRDGPTATSGAAPALPGRARVLIAEDNETDRKILTAIVEDMGWQVICAKDGVEAVSMFSDQAPDVVLMDAMMPRMDGLEAVREIRRLAGDTFVPIIFLTALSDTADLVGCLDAGGDDFLPKPYNRVILRAKLAAFSRMGKLHAELLAQREQVVDNNAHLLNEQEVAKAVFDNVIQLSSLDSNNLKHMLSPLAIFNGDVLLASRNPNGGMNVFIGDFTGHGLPAAIGAMPTAEIFYGMTAKGFQIAEILREINAKLKRVLPVGVFCCASMVELNFTKRTLEIWHGGLPEAWLRRANGEIETIRSKHLPLGVMDPKRFDARAENFIMLPGDRIFLCSDGILEARNPDGEMFGYDRLANVFTVTEDADCLFDDVRSRVTEFVGGSEREDDLTMVEAMMVDEDSLDVPVPSSRVDTAAGPIDWKLTYELGPESLAQFNPLPLLQHVLMEVPGLRKQSGELYAVLAELYTNAVDHGVIGLASDMKDSAEGFARYQEERAERLTRLRDGFVRFHFEHVPTMSGGELRITLTDSGDGFDYAQVDDFSKISATGLSGRGIAMVMNLCSSVRYSGNGSRVEAVYPWHAQQ